VQTLAEQQGSPRFVAVDARAVYWTNFDTGEVMALDL
jgi:hypothetical protein